MTRKHSRTAIAGDLYFALVKTFPLRPIHTDSAHQEALRMLRNLSNETDSVANDYKTVLLALIVKYEQDAGYRIDTSHITPADTIRFILEQREMSVNALAKAIKVSQSSLNEMLNGKRDWSKSAIIKLSDYFKLNPAMFLRAR
jgi:antitoxin component HigA of HigAB toxin-antitoxin module